MQVRCLVDAWKPRGGIHGLVSLDCGQMSRRAEGKASSLAARRCRSCTVEKHGNLHCKLGSTLPHALEVLSYCNASTVVQAFGDHGGQRESDSAQALGQCHSIELVQGWRIGCLTS